MNALAHFASRHFDSLYSHVWSSTIFLLLVLLVLFAARHRLTAGARFALALAGIIKFAIPVALFSPAVRRLDAWLNRGTAEALDLPLQVLGGTFAFAAPSHARGSGLAIGLVTWLVVAVALIVGSAVTRRRLVALSLRTAAAATPREVQALARAKARLGLRRSIDIARAALPEAPAVLRVLRPLVVLPLDGCDELSDDELESLLRHECAHVARHDNLIARIESIVCALFWFHPLIWIALRVTVIERERACDEVVSGSADERRTYLAALRKFCHAAIAPRLPGVSCMATANLKERIEHVMNYENLKQHAPAPRRVTAAAGFALILFTLAAGLVRTGDALAAEGGSASGYSVKVSATRQGPFTVVNTTVRENATGQIIASPSVTIDESRVGSARSGRDPGADVLVELRPGPGASVDVEVTIEKDGTIVQRSNAKIVAAEAAPPRSRYTGQPITLSLKDADLHDVINTFGQLTGYEMKVPEGIDRKVSVNWQNVPWDEAFATLMDENDLTYTIDGKTIRIAKK